MWVISRNAMFNGPDTTGGCGGIDEGRGETKLDDSRGVGRRSRECIFAGR